MVACIRNLAVKKKHRKSGDFLEQPRRISALGSRLLPSCWLAVLYDYGHNAPLVLSLFSGRRAIVVALMANAVLGFGTSTIVAATSNEPSSKGRARASGHPEPAARWHLLLRRGNHLLRDVHCLHGEAQRGEEAALLKSVRG